MRIKLDVNLKLADGSIAAAGIYESPVEELVAELDNGSRFVSELPDLVQPVVAEEPDQSEGDDDSEDDSGDEETDADKPAETDADKPAETDADKPAPKTTGKTKKVRK